MDDRSNRNRFIRNPLDFIGGCVLLILAGWVLWSIRDLPGQRGFQLGPGSVPRLFASLLAVNALIVMGLSIFERGPSVRYEIKPAIGIVSLSGFGFAVYQIAGPIAAVLALSVAAFLLIERLTALGIRGPAFITISILSFAAFVKPLGLFLAVFFLVAISSAASTEYRFRESIVWALGLATFSILLFILLLNVPVAAFPPVLLTR